MGVDDGGADELEPALLEILADGVGDLGARGDILHGLEAVHDGSAVRESPDVFRETAELFLSVEECAGVRDGRFDLQAIADDVRILQ